MKMFRLDGHVAFVTGAGSGIGQSISVGLAEAGADVACFDLPNSPTMSDTVGMIEERNRKALVLEGSVTNADQIAAAVSESERLLGPLRVAVNAAGIANLGSAEEMPLNQWQGLLDINLTGIFLSCQAEAKVMLSRSRGSIVNIASMSGSIVNRGINQCHYNTAKAGVVHLSKSLAMELVDRGVRVNALSPGYTATPMNKRAEVADQIKRFESDTPMGRMAKVEEMIGPAIFLASEASSYVTGLNLLVDGGFQCW